MQKISRWQWLDFPVVDSTNNLAREKSFEFDGNPVVITAVEQTAGRGRRGRNWVSAKGNLFMSQLLELKQPISELVFVISLSIAETLSALISGVDINIKWPNDVLINGAKICGILIETAENGTVIIGTGVNLVSSPNSTQTLYKTTSLKELGFNVSREEFLQAFLPRFDTNIDICSRSFAEIRAKWLAYACRLGEKIKVAQKDKVIEGIFKGIDEQGLLLLEQKEKIIKIAVGDVFL